MFALSLLACSGEDQDSTDTTQESTTKTSEADASADDSANPVSSSSTTTATASEPAPAAGGLVSLPSTPITNANPLPALSVSDYVVVSSRRTGRTRTEYTLKIKVANAGSQRYENVLATLVSAPAHITVIDGIVNLDTVPPNAVVLSPDTFIIDVNLAVSTSFEDLLWNFEGDVAQPPPPPPPSGGPSAPGIYMSIDDNAIPGESTSASHKDWIVLSAFTEGLRRDNLGTSGSTRIRSSFVFDGVTADKLLDKSSPKLREALLDGRFFGEIKIDIIASCGGGNYTVYAITLSSAQIAALSLFAANETPNEAVGLIYSRIETMYTPVENDCTLLPPVYSTQDGSLLG
ncbi:MAG: type VI secretion system tube protein Hcp, partial [Gammaproteobacteria bacterium]